MEPEETLGAHGELLKLHFKSLTAGNAMKPAYLQRTEENFDFSSADIIANFAVENGMELRGHTLLWHNQVPDWFFLDTEGKEMLPTAENRELLISRLENHITTVVSHYRGIINTWDVVNEVIDTDQADNLRHTKWYEIIGPEYIDMAFEFARAADPDVKLIINDYSTTNPAKRDVLYALVNDMLSRGIPVDGVGHQFHINVSAPSIQSMRETIELFAGLGIDNQITELDMSVYTNSTDSWDVIPEEILIKQGHRYADVFNLFRDLNDVISSVTFWGIADDNTWLKHFPITRLDLPLLFDEDLQAKHAYWGVVDQKKLPVLIKELEAPEAINNCLWIDGRSEIDWDVFAWESLTESGTFTGGFKSLWKDDKLFLLLEVNDTTINYNDCVEIFLDLNNDKTDEYGEDDIKISTQRWSWPTWEIRKRFRKIDEGYRFEAAIPLDIALESGMTIGFDIRITDAERPGNVITWNDLLLGQDDSTLRYGNLKLTKAFNLSYAVKGTPVIDGEIEMIWEKAKTIETNTWVIGTQGATARVKTLWDNAKLYVLAEVTDPLLSDSSSNPWEHDAIEIFVDQNNGKTSFYEEDDGQYRINYNNVQSYGGVASEENLESAVVITETGYIVEAAVTIDHVNLEAGTILGFDLQVNDDGLGDGVRSSVVIWNDDSGISYLNTSHFGALCLTGPFGLAKHRFGFIKKKLSQIFFF